MSDGFIQPRNPYQPALDRARLDLARVDPYAAAARAGGEVLRGADGPEVQLRYWRETVRVAWARGQVVASDGSSLPLPAQLLLLHYLITADGTPLADRWSSFRDLPDGRFYDGAFRKRACLPLARAFGERPDLFVAAGERLDGTRLTYGDVSFMFRVLPRVRVAVILHTQDDEFPADANLLFDAALRHYLPIEDVAVLGGMVAVALLRARAPRPEAQ